MSGQQTAAAHPAVAHPAVAHQEGAARYEIRIQGHLAARRLDCFAHTTIVHLPDGQTRIVSLLRDQAALHGLLDHLYHLGVTLLSVQRLDDPKGE